jgi:hypothetical protein
LFCTHGEGWCKKSDGAISCTHYFRVKNTKRERRWGNRRFQLSQGYPVHNSKRDYWAILNFVAFRNKQTISVTFTAFNHLIRKKRGEEY